MNWHPANGEVRSSGWSRIPDEVEGEEVDVGERRADVHEVPERLSSPPEGDQVAGRGAVGVRGDER